MDELLIVRNVGGKFPMLLVVVCCALYQIAPPDRNIMEASVTMNDGIPSTATQSPFSAPTPDPSSNITTVATGAARIEWAR